VAYTAETLAAFVATELGPTGVALGLTAESVAVAEAVAEVAAILGVDDVADLADDLKTRTLARWQAWLAAWGAATNQYDIASQGDSLDRQQWFKNIGERLARAEASAMRYDEAAAVISGGSVATVTSSSVAGSPYAWHCPGGW
jgi:hypothetical protein